MPTCKHKARVVMCSCRKKGLPFRGPSDQRDGNPRPGIFRGVDLDDGMDRQSSIRTRPLLHLPENVMVTHMMGSYIHMRHHSAKTACLPKTTTTGCRSTSRCLLYIAYLPTLLDWYPHQRVARVTPRRSGTRLR